MDWKCPNCGTFTLTQDECSNCGAKLDGSGKSSAQPDAHGHSDDVPLELDDTRTPHRSAPQERAPSSPNQIPASYGRKVTPDFESVDAALAERNRQTKRRALIGVVAVSALAIGGYYAINAIIGRHVKTTWGEDPTVPASITKLILNPAPDEHVVQSVCALQWDRARAAQQQLAQAPEPSRQKIGAELLKHWEALDDARSVIAGHKLTDKASEIMAACAAADQRIGDYFIQFDGNSQPSVTDGSPLTPALIELQDTFTPPEARAVNDAGMADNRAPDAGTGSNSVGQSK